MTGVVVLGSANVDLVVCVERRPMGGETLLGSDVHVSPGGKGGNQAAAAARAGAPTRFLGCTGADRNAEFLLDHLKRAGVDVGDVRAGSRPTGTATILLTPDGENSIVVSPGANHEFDAQAACSLQDVWLAAGVLVLSLEIPLSTVRLVADRARSAKTRVLLNAAPAAMIDESLLAVCDPLVVNEHEARSILNDAEPSLGFEHLAAELLRRGAVSVVITLGAEGAVVADRIGIDVIPAYRIGAVDTTGAGDAFVGATASELARGADLRDAVGFATAFSALSVLREGAQTSYPERADVERLIRETTPPPSSD